MNNIVFIPVKKGILIKIIPFYLTEELLTMKRKLSLILSFFLLLAIVPVYAQTVTTNPSVPSNIALQTWTDAQTGLSFILHSDNLILTAAVTHCSLPEGTPSLIIPDNITVNGQNYTVTAIDANALDNLSQIPVLIPDEEAFESKP